MDLFALSVNAIVFVLQGPLQTFLQAAQASNEGSEAPRSFKQMMLVCCVFLTLYPLGALMIHMQSILTGYSSG